MMRLMGGATVVAVGVMLAPIAVQAQTPALVNARVEISAAVAGSSATLEAIERQANARDRARQAEIAALQTRLTEAEGRGAAEVTSLQAQLVEAREALVTDLAARDRAYAREIAVFRREVTDIAATPEGAAALARFNAGDHVGAIAVLDRLIEAEDAARQTRANIESAVARRRVATLALDARGKGDPAFDTGAVIARYEAVVRLDPESYADWLQLFFLYQDAGRSSDALAATERMQQLSKDEAELGQALLSRGDILVIQGDLAGAGGLYESSAEIRGRLSEAEPASAELAEAYSVAIERSGEVLLSQRDPDTALILFRASLRIRERLSAADPASVVRAQALSVALEKLGDVLNGEGFRERSLRRFDVNTAPAEALAVYQRSLEIRERLSAADPNSTDLARDVSVSLQKNGDALRRQGWRHLALALYERSLEIFERLSAADPASAVLARDVSMSLERVGDVLVSKEDHDGAMALYLRSLEIRERLSAADPASEVFGRELRDFLDKLADFLMVQGDRQGALSRYQRSLEIRERLAAANPASATLAMNLSIFNVRLARITGERRYWARALAILRDLEATGRLNEWNRPFMAEVEEGLASFAMPEN